MRALRRLLKLTLKLAILAGIGVGGGYYGYQLYYLEAEMEDPLGELPTVVAEVRDITVSVSATGVLQPIKIVEIKSKASGEILEMPVELGDFVQAGDLIAQVDTRILDQELKQAEADYASNKTRLEIAGKQYLRAQELHVGDLISENDLEQSEQNFVTAEAQMLRSEAQLELAKERLEDATVTAPITGTVIAKTVEEGQIIASSTNNVSGGTILIQMADLSELEIRTLVDEIDIGQVKPGLFVESTVEAFAVMEFEGEVMKIEPQAVVQQSVTTFPVLSRIDNSEGLLLPGMNADVSIIIHRRPRVLAVPNEAVRTPEDARQVVELLGLDAVEEVRSSLLTAIDGASRAGGAGTSSRPETQATESAVVDQGASPNRHNGDNGSGLTRRRQAGANTGDRGGRTGQGAPGAPGGRGGQGRGSTDMRARFENASPEERERLMQQFRRGREEAEEQQQDTWGIEGRREPGVVFMLGDDGQLVAKQIVAGVRDWEVTQVLSGLEEGDEIVLLPSTSLLRSQAAMRERLSRRSSVIPGAGGVGRR